MLIQFRFIRMPLYSSPPSRDISKGRTAMPAYQLICLNDHGRIVRMLAVQCDNDNEAVRRGIEEMADDCAALEITSTFNERIIWRGTRAEAVEVLSGTSEHRTDSYASSL
jgi:hypothetical protein